MRRYQPSDCLISCLIYKFLIQLRSKIRNKRDKRDSPDLRDSAENPGLGPGLKIEKSGTGDLDRDERFQNSVPGTENFPGHGPGPVPTPDLAHTGVKLFEPTSCI